LKVLHTVASLRSSYGGPARSVPALAAALRQCGCETVVWAPDGSGEGDGSFEGSDLVHDHGIWLPHNWRLARAAGKTGIPRIVSARGMLHPWAMQHKKWKKRLAWLLYQRRQLREAACLHATSETEVGHIGKLGLGVPVCMIPNGVDVPAEEPAKVHRQDGLRTALFLGRIYPVKGLPLLVEAWNRVRPKGWILEIAGPDEAGHQREVEKAIRQAGLENEIVLTGPVNDAGKRDAFARAELFILPSYTENFGMAIAEALAHGVPVITTTGTPWAFLVEKNCGWWVAPSVDGICQALDQALNVDPGTLEQMGHSGRKWMADEFSWEAAASEMARVYQWVLGSGIRPNCVQCESNMQAFNDATI